MKNKRILLLAFIITAAGGFIIFRKASTNIDISKIENRSNRIDISLTPSSEKDLNLKPNVIIPEWQSYINKEYKYAFQYPPELEATTTDYSVLFNTKSDKPGPTTLPALYVSVIPEGAIRNPSIYNYISTTDINNFYQAKVGDNIQSTGAPAEYWVYKKLPSITVGDKSAIVVENTKVWEAGEKTRDRRVFITINKVTYMIGTYYILEEELNRFVQALNTVSIL